MSYMNHDEIRAFCEAGHIKNYDPDCINAASIDLRIGKEIMCECGGATHQMLDYRKRDKPAMQTVFMDEGGFAIYPGQFFLAHTMEICDFPDDVAALFRIKSSMGRVGLEHMDAGWVDPGFHGALTLEYKLMLERHWLRIRPRDRIGQLVLFRGNPVSADKSYRAKGNYNGATGVKQVGYEK